MIFLLRVTVARYERSCYAVETTPSMIHKTGNLTRVVVQLFRTARLSKCLRKGLVVATAATAAAATTATLQHRHHSQSSGIEEEVPRDVSRDTSGCEDSPEPGTFSVQFGVILCLH